MSQNFETPSYNSPQRLRCRSTYLAEAVQNINPLQIDYGCFIYGAARKTYFNPLNTVHHEGLRLTLRAFRTSPVESLYSEAYEPPLKLRIIKLGLQYYCKLKSLPTNPTHDCIFYPKQKSLFDQKEKTIKPFGLRMKHILEETDISLTSIHDTIHLSSLSLGDSSSLSVSSTKNKLPKNKTHPLIYQEKLNNIQEIYPNYHDIFTDGSKSNYGTGYGVVLHKKSLKKCLQKKPPYFLPKSML